jgi:hypothetical protein
LAEIFLTGCQGFGYVPVSIIQILPGSYNKRKQSTVFRCASLHYKPRLLRALLLQKLGEIFSFCFGNWVPSSPLMGSVVRIKIAVSFSVLDSTRSHIVIRSVVLGALVGKEQNALRSVGCQ